MNIYGKKVRIVNKARFTMALLIVLLSILSILMLSFHSVSGNENIIYKDYVVTSGDTLWMIADEITNKTQDLREVVYQIADVNDIGGSDHIYPGQVLKVPSW